MYICLSSSTLFKLQHQQVLDVASSSRHTLEATLWKKVNFRVLYFMAAMLEPCSADLPEIFQSSHTKHSKPEGIWRGRGREACSVALRGVPSLQVWKKKCLWKKGHYRTEVPIAIMTVISHLKLVERSLSGKVSQCKDLYLCLHWFSVLPYYPVLKGQSHIESQKAYSCNLK